MDLVAPIDPKTLLKQAFPGLSDASVEAVAGLARTQTYPPGAVLCRQGAIEDTFYLVSAGRVEILHELGDGQERLLRQAEPGAFFGELAIIMDAPRAATVRTLEPTTVLELDKATFVHMLGQNPSIGLTIMGTVLGWLRANEERSIAELEAKTRQLEATYNALAQRERQRTAFLTTVATGLRAPLAAAQAELSRIKSQPVEVVDPKSLDDSARRLRQSLDTVVQQVNDLLFVQSLEPIQSPKRPVEVGGLLRSLVAEGRSRALAKRVQIAAAIAPDLPPVPGDEEGLARSFHVLLSHAIECSPDGGAIVLTARLHRGQVELAITDSGLPIPTGVIDRLFGPFDHEDAAETYPEWGIRLAIARYWVEYHGGTIMVQSQAGKGNTFVVRLPGDARQS